MNLQPPFVITRLAIHPRQAKACNHIETGGAGYTVI